MKKVTDEDFQLEVREAELPTVVVFTGSWCAPCKAMKPDLEFLAEAFEGDVDFVEMDIESSDRTAADLAIRSVPTLVMFNDGMIRDTLNGKHSKSDIRQWVNESV